jgi:hypothetical protein
MAVSFEVDGFISAQQRGGEVAECGKLREKFEFARCRWAVE